MYGEAKARMMLISLTYTLVELSSGRMNDRAGTKTSSKYTLKTLAGKCINIFTKSEPAKDLVVERQTLLAADAVRRGPHDHH